MARLQLLFALASMVVLSTLVVSLLAVTSLPAHASANAGVTGTPRFIPFHHNFSEAALAASHLPHWSSTFQAEGKKYKYTMVGTNPANGSATTTVPVTIVPLNLVFSNGQSFDGTSQVSQAINSPLFQNAPFISGTTQYGDAVARAEFWNYVSSTSPNYHVLVGTPTVDNTLTINIPSADGQTIKDPFSGKTIGLININWFDPQIQVELTALGFTPSMLPIFLSRNVYLTQGSPHLRNCCFGGYHEAVYNSSGLQTFIWSNDADEGVQGGFSDDVDSLSHEILEWFNDPFGSNIVPNWISPIVPQFGCNNVLEVGDPLGEVTFMVSGYSGDHLQDVAFFSWFARQSPSNGINGQYTYLGTFTSLSKKC